MPYDEKLAERIRAKLRGTRGLTEKKMFGGVGFMVNGNMICGVNKEDLIVRLANDDSERALKQPHARLFDMTGRPMKGWLLIAPKGLTTEKALHSWIEKSLEFAKSLPPNQP
jgi:TfoX/Sxy family transcriptional regulator of competence genes